MIIDSQVLHTGIDDIFSAHGNSVAVSPRRFKDIADDDETVSKDAYNKITKLLDHNKVFVAPFCDAALIYRHLNNLYTNARPSFEVSFKLSSDPKIISL